MRITAEISMYPLQETFVPRIKAFILALRTCDRLEIVSNQLSTQVRGEFDAVTGGINRCMQVAMEQEGTAVFVVKYLNADLPIATVPSIGSDPR